MSRTSRNNWLTALSSAGTGLMQGYAAGAKQKLEQDKLAELVRESRRKEFGEGFTRDEGGNITVDPAYYTKDTPAYQRGNRESELKRMATGALSVPAMRDYSKFSTLKEFSDLGIGAEDLKNTPKEHAYEKIIESHYKPQTPGNVAATPQQKAHYEGVFKLPPGGADNLTSSQYESGIRYYGGQTAAGERQGNAIANSNSRQDKSLGQQKEFHDETLKFNKDKAVVDQRTSTSQSIGDLERLSENISTAKRLQPSGADYYKLQAKSMANSATFGGFKSGPLKGLTSLDDKEQERLNYYSTLSQDAIRTLFSQGGKALTANEEKLARQLAIQGTDSTPNILAKQEAVRKYAASKLRLQLDEIERINPGRNSDLRERLESALVNLEEGDTSLAPDPSAQRAVNARNPRTQGGRLDAYKDPSIQAVIQDPAGVDPKTKATAGAKLDKIKGKAPAAEEAPPGMDFEQFKAWKAKRKK